MSNFTGNRWIQRSKETMKKGALRAQLHIKAGKTISPELLEKIVATPLGKKARGATVTRLLKLRANWALNVRGGKRK